MLETDIDVPESIAIFNCGKQRLSGVRISLKNIYFYLIWKAEWERQLSSSYISPKFLQ